MWLSLSLYMVAITITLATTTIYIMAGDRSRALSAIRFNIVLMGWFAIALALTSVLDLL